jgi:hypothetical protein
VLNSNRYDIDIRASPMGRCITGPILLIPILLTLIRTKDEIVKMQSWSRLRPFLLNSGTHAHDEAERVIYTCRLPCLRLGAREFPCAGTRKINGHAANFAEAERSGAREVKVGSRA